MTDIDVRTLRTTGIIFAAMELDPDLLNVDDVEVHRATINEWLEQYGLTIDPLDVFNGGNVHECLEKAKLATGLDKIDLICKAYRKAQSYYYGQWANGKIKAKKEPMPDDVKQMLRERNQPQPDDKTALEQYTIRQLEKMDENQIKAAFNLVFGPQTKQHTTDFKQRLLINNIAKEVKAGKMPDIPDNTALVVSGETESEIKGFASKSGSKKSKPKLALWQDKAAQKEKEAAYPWVKSGSWRKDPNKEGGTIADIVCQTCGGLREVHLADCFQIKYCISCKKLKKIK
jgi:hypothetical protein